MSLFGESTGEIHIKLEKSGELSCMKVIGSPNMLASMIGALIRSMIDNGFDRELLKYAVDQGFIENKSKSDKDFKKENVIVKELHFDSKEELDKFVEKLLKGDK